MKTLDSILLSRRQMLALGLASGATIGLVACGGADESAETATSESVGEGEGLVDEQEAPEVDAAAFDALLATGPVAADDAIAASAWAKKIKDAGTLIAACTEAGANEFNGVSYSCTEYDKFYGEALKEAVTSSKEKAALLAEAAGRTLGEVTRISEGWQDTTFEANAKGVSSMEGAGALDEGAGASILPGQAEITATVTVTYILK
jgi:hypothetical protein